MAEEGVASPAGSGGSMMDTMNAPDRPAEVGKPGKVAMPPSSRIARQAFRLKLRYALFALGAIVLIVGSVAYWLSGGRYVETDDAYVQGNVLEVSTDVVGLVDQILVHEGEHVQKGQELFRLDPTSFQLAVDQAKANLAQTALQLKSLRADYVSGQYQVAVEQANVDADRATYERYAALITHKAVTQQQYDDAKYKLMADQAALGVAGANSTGTLARLGGKADLPVDSMPAYKLATAQLGQAERDLRHSSVRAAFAGVASEVSKLQPGEYLAAGTAAFGLTDTKNIWIAAQPKETDLTYARLGDPATVTVDAYPGRVWHGELQSVAPATDQEFSVLPAQNSSGNWVKVVQRVPLRVAIHVGPDDPPLTAGMSAEVSIDTHHRRTLGDLF
jgi:membrane fusion protein (multidrug efflux system)